MNPTTTEARWEDGIPIVGHLKALIYLLQRKDKISSTTFNQATRNAGAACFGVFGGHIAGSAGAIAGSIIGGLFLDAKISELSLDNYGYFGYIAMLNSQNMTPYAWFGLLHLAFKDSFIGLLTLNAYNEYNIMKQSWTKIHVGNQTEIYFDWIMEKVLHNDDYSKIGIGALQLSWKVDIPVVGHVKGYLLFALNKKDLAFKTFKRTLRQTHVLVFGVVGGHLAECITGFFIGGIIGGVIVDAQLSQVSSNGYGYFYYYERLKRHQMGSDDWSNLLFLAARDGITGVSPLAVYNICQIPMQSLTDRESQYEMYYIFGLKEAVTGNGTEINCFSIACEKPDIIKDDDFKDHKSIQKPFTLRKLPEVHKLPVSSILKLNPGDHIFYKRRAIWIYYHHAVVGEVFPEEDMYTVYEQSSSTNMQALSLFGKATIKKNKKRFDTESFYKIDHGEKALPSELICKSAHYICHHAAPSFFNKRYNLVTNNCEHFANFCATGLHESLQVQESSNDFIELFKFLSIVAIVQTIYIVCCTRTRN